MAIRIKGEEDKVKKEQRIPKIPDPRPPETRSESLVEASATRDPNLTFQEEKKEEAKPSLQQHEAKVGNEPDVLEEETKENIKKSSEETVEQIPKFTTVVNTLQEQNIQMGAEAAESYFKLQEQLINSIRTTWILYAEQATNLFWNSFLAPPRMLELYTNYITNFADTWILANRNVSSSFTENMEKVNINLEQAKRISNDLAGACMNFAKMETKNVDDIHTKSRVSQTQEEQVTATKTKKDS
ncbi:MAG TPA: hypothetical protein VH415_06440 [Nitrososphaeraceae archaeon]|jgi:hypothetical protein